MCTEASLVWDKKNLIGSEELCKPISERYVRERVTNIRDLYHSSTLNMHNVKIYSCSGTKSLPDSSGIMLQSPCNNSAFIRVGGLVCGSMRGMIIWIKANAQNDIMLKLTTAVAATCRRLTRPSCSKSSLRCGGKRPQLRAGMSLCLCTLDELC